MAIGPSVPLVRYDSYNQLNMHILKTFKNSKNNIEKKHKKIQHDKNALKNTKNNIEDNIKKNAPDKYIKTKKTAKKQQRKGQRCRYFPESLRMDPAKNSKACR